MRPALRDAALRWIADDPDPATRSELQRVLAAALTGDAAAAADLADRMAGPLRFGTAGLRGPVRAGPNGMNVAVVRRTTAGLAAWLRGTGHAGATVVVGRDARHGSDAFAAAAAAVLAGAGFDVRVLPAPLPTPLLAFAVQALRAAAGVQVTASHNPPADNGYKVYVGTAPYPGAQLTTPDDTAIEALIAAAPAAVAVPLGTRAGVADVREAYLDRVARLPRGSARALRVALTPLHGVGGETAVLALARAGFSDVHVVASQAVPDAAFPTVAFPNPEEPGVTDALLELAARVDADLAVALDPDADRCALGVPGPDGWRMLSGDETGVLLGDHVLRHHPHDDPLVASTVVSSSMLRAVAAAHGARFAETLTGFKWIVRAGPGLVYGYEEALGHCVDPETVRDKDGIATAVLACDLAAGLKAAGRGLPDRLDELAAAHGVHATLGISLRLDPAARDAVAARLRAHPPAGWAADLPAPDVLVLRRTPDERVVVRPSGTEPKLKAYLQVVEPVETDVATARAAAATRLAALRAEVSTLLTLRLIDPPGSRVGAGSSLPPVPRPKVHDAALRTRLLECAGATLSTGGLAALSLRTLAAAVGTSTTAVYALFGGKPGLLEALHAEAFSRLGARLGAVPVGADPVEDLIALGRAYRAAALAEPHFYEVMFGGALPSGTEWWSTAAPAFRPVVELVERAVACGALRSGTQVATVSLALWATVHGLVSLHLRGLHPTDGPAPDEVFDQALRAVVSGWLATPVPRPGLSTQTAPNWRSPASPRPGTM